MLRKGLRLLAGSRRLANAVEQVPVTRALSRRFVAGESVEDFLSVARVLREEGFRVTSNHLGEYVGSEDEARAAARAYMEVLDAMVGTEVDINVSVKLSQLGLALSSRLALENLETVLDRAESVGAFVRFDMESSDYTARTLEIFEELWNRGRRGIGIVLQACLRRTAGDVRRMIDLGASVRLCKGAYEEPPEIAFTEMHRIRHAFRELSHWLLSEGRALAIATHDERLIRDAVQFTSRERIDRDRFEFQLLYGVRRDLQQTLVDQGYRVRVYIPFGENWYPYLMRRLAERPENALFLARSLVKESPLGRLLPGRRRPE